MEFVQVWYDDRYWSKTFVILNLSELLYNIQSDYALTALY